MHDRPGARIRRLQRRTVENGVEVFGDRQGLIEQEIIVAHRRNLAERMGLAKFGRMVIDRIEGERDALFSNAMRAVRV